MSLTSRGPPSPGPNYKAPQLAPNILKRLAAAGAKIEQLQQKDSYAEAEMQRNGLAADPLTGRRPLHAPRQRASGAQTARVEPSSQKTKPQGRRGSYPRPWEPKPAKKKKAAGPQARAPPRVLSKPSPEMAAKLAAMGMLNSQPAPSNSLAARAAARKAAPKPWKLGKFKGSDSSEASSVTVAALAPPTKKPITQLQPNKMTLAEILELQKAKEERRRRRLERGSNGPDHASESGAGSAASPAPSPRPDIQQPRRSSIGQQVKTSPIPAKAKAPVPRRPSLQEETKSVPPRKSSIVESEAEEYEEDFEPIETTENQTEKEKEKEIQKAKPKAAAEKSAIPKPWQKPKPEKSHPPAAAEPAIQVFDRESKLEQPNDAKPAPAEARSSPRFKSKLKEPSALSSSASHPDPAAAPPKADMKRHISIDVNSSDSDQSSRGSQTSSPPIPVPFVSPNAAAVRVRTAKASAEQSIIIMNSEAEQAIKRSKSMQRRKSAEAEKHANRDAEPFTGRLSAADALKLRDGAEGSGGSLPRSGSKPRVNVRASTIATLSPIMSPVGNSAMFSVESAPETFERTRSPIPNLGESDDGEEEDELGNRNELAPPKKHRRRRKSILEQSSVWATSIPAVLVLESFQFLGLTDLLILRRVCHAWSIASRQPSTWIYTHLDLSDSDDLLTSQLPQFNCIPYLRSLVLGMFGAPFGSGGQKFGGPAIAASPPPVTLEQVFDYFPLLQRLKIPAFRQESPALLLKLPCLEMLELPVDDPTGHGHGLFMRTDQLARVFTQLPELRILNISHTDGGDEYAELISQCNKLEILDVSDNYLTDAGVSSLAKCPNLTALNLTFNHQLTGEGLKKLSAGLPTLRILMLDEGIAKGRSVALSTLSQLESLSIDCLPTLAPLTQLINLQSLTYGVNNEEFDPTQTKRLPDDEWLRFFSSPVAKQLLSLRVSDNYMSCPVIQSMIDNCRQLLVLMLDQVSSDRKLKLSKPTGLTMLRNLMLNECRWANDNFILAIVAHCRYLQYIKSTGVSPPKPETKDQLHEKKIYCIYQAFNEEIEEEELMKEMLQLKYPRLDVPVRGGYSTDESELFERANYLNDLKRTAIEYAKMENSDKKIHHVGEWIWYPAVEVQMWLED